MTIHNVGASCVQPDQADPPLVPTRVQIADDPAITWSDLHPANHDIAISQTCTASASLSTPCNISARACSQGRGRDCSCQMQSRNNEPSVGCRFAPLAHLAAESNILAGSHAADASAADSTRSFGQHFSRLYCDCEMTADCFFATAHCGKCLWAAVVDIEIEFD